VYPQFSTYFLDHKLTVLTSIQKILDPADCEVVNESQSRRTILVSDDFPIENSVTKKYDITVKPVLPGVSCPKLLARRVSHW
jgi:hypothetical protein